MSWWIVIGGTVIVMVALLTALNAGELRTEFRDKNGFFMGHSIKNQFGTTSYYDRNGHFQGTETRHK